MSTRIQQVEGVECPGCQRVFGSKQALGGHSRFCAIRNAAEAPGAPFVAKVGHSPAPQPQRLLEGPGEAPDSQMPLFVAAVEAPPPPAPPPQAEVTQYVPRMPLPNEAAGTGGTRAEYWQPEQAFATRLEPLHGAEAVVMPAVAMAAPNSPPATVSVHQAPQAEAVQGGELAVVESGPQVDIVKVLEVLSKRMFVWEGSGPLTQEECELLRTVITWKPGPAAGVATVLSAVFLPRILTHPAVASRLVGLLDRWIAVFDEAPAAPSPQRPQAEAPAAQASEPATPRPRAVDRSDELERAWAERGVDLAAVRSAEQAGRSAERGAA